MTDCVFCRIARGELPATFVYQDDAIMAFHDTSPLAPTHILIVPRQHILNTTEVNEQNALLVGKMVQVAAQVARDQNVEAGGYRLIMNTGQNGGQVVMHLHMHLLGGRRLGRLG